MRQCSVMLAVATVFAAVPAPVAAGHVTGPIRLIVAPQGNEARYRVREQLVGVDFPNDAVGTTNEITGRLVIGADGKIVREQSKITVNVASLKSDRDRRDAFLKRRTLVSDSFPTVTLVPTAVSGLPSPIPASGPFSFDVTGDFTVKGVTRPTTWHVSATADHGSYSGSASTKFTFDDFKLEQPRIRILLSVADTIKLEYDFKLVPDTARSS